MIHLIFQTNLPGRYNNYSIFKVRKGGTEKVSNLAKVTQEVAELGLR